MPKFFSDAHLSGSSTDLTLDGQLFLPSTTSDPGAAVPISFDSGATSHKEIDLNLKQTEEELIKLQKLNLSSSHLSQLYF